MQMTDEVDRPAEHGRLRLCLPTEGVACTVCGVYFTCMRTMKTHRTKMHEVPQEDVSSTARLNHAEHSKDGMPQCLHCDRRFTRVEALKKHLKGSCPVLHSRPMEQVPESEPLNEAKQSPACGAGDCERAAWACVPGPTCSIAGNRRSAGRT